MRTATLLAVLAASSFTAHAGVIFTEDFESYSVGSDISGQGGWLGDTGAEVGSSANLDGNSSNHADAGTYKVVYQDLGASFTTGGLYSMSFDGYASTVGVDNSNSVIGFANSSLGTSTTARLSWTAYAAVHGGPHWVFDARALTGNSGDFQSISGGYDQRLTFELFVDTVLMEVYGTYDYGGGRTETNRYAINATQLATLDGISLFHDNRTPGSYNPAEFDNISVSYDAAASVPISGLPSLFLLGMIGMGWRLRVRDPGEGTL